MDRQIVRERGVMSGSEADERLHECNRAAHEVARKSIAHRNALSDFEDGDLPKAFVLEAKAKLEEAIARYVEVCKFNEDDERSE